MGLPQLPDGTLLVAIPGLTPTKGVDIPISAIFIAILFPLAIRNVFLFVTDRKRGFIFPMSMVLFGFCMARISTFAMRIAWTNNLTNVGVATAAQIFSAAGVVLLYVINLILWQRLNSHLHPWMGRVVALRVVFVGYIISLVVLLILIIISTVNFVSGNPLKQWHINTRKVAPVYFTVFAFLPIPLTALTLLLPRRSEPGPLGRDGSSLTSKAAVILIAAFPLTLGSAVRAGTAFFAPRTYRNPAWYHSKAVFYIFMIVLELIAVASFMISRFDLKFYSGKNAYIYGKGGSDEETAGEESVDVNTKGEKKEEKKTEEESE